MKTLPILVILVLFAAGANLLLAQTYAMPCTSIAKSGSGICIEPFHKPRLLQYPEHAARLMQYSFFLKGQVTYPPAMRIAFGRRYLDCLMPGSCELSNDSLMHGTYAIRDGMGRVDLEYKFTHGFVNRIIKYNNRTGTRQSTMDFPPEAWVVDDGVKLLSQIFDERTGRVILSSAWELRNGRFRKRQPSP
jgi:hypothetical protein